MDIPPLRVATTQDMPAIEALMKSSILEFFPRFYDQRQTRASIGFIGVPDRDLVEDGTYYVAESGGELVAAGGWSKREKLHAGSGGSATDDRLLDPATEPAHVRAMFVHPAWARRGLGRAILEASEAAAKKAGFTRMSLMATLPGEKLYAAFGFRERAVTDVTMPDGTQLRCVDMEKFID